MNAVLPRVATRDEPPPVAFDMPRNAIYGYTVVPGSADMREPPIARGARRVDRPDSMAPSGAAVFALPNTNVRVQPSAAHRSCVYLWGCPAHRDVRRNDLPEWCAAAVAREQFDLFRDLLGTFVVLVDEPFKRRLTIVSDLLGIRPLFTMRQAGRFVFGSDVWALRAAGLVDASVDYDAVSAWTAYGFNCTEGSLFSGVRRMPPGAAVVVEDGRTTTIAYGAFDIGARTRTVEQAADEIHEIVSGDVETLLSEESALVVPLSGGYDSRYLLALAVQSGARIERVLTVRFSPAEGDVAARVADILGVPLETVPVDGSVWDLYDDVHHFMPDGFPISKFVTFRLAREATAPLMNGFLGDSLVRGSNDRFGGRSEEQCAGDMDAVLQQKQLAISLNLFRPDLARRLVDRAVQPMRAAVAHGGCHVFAWADLYLRQRHYISNNFLQHLDDCEALLPFYSWRLIAYKLAHARDAFSRRTYEQLFARHVPRLASIPHASDLTPHTRRTVLADCAVQWARELVAPLVRPEWLTVLSTPYCLPLVSLGAARLASLNQYVSDTVEDAVFTCRRLYLLERRFRDASIAFDWNAV